MEADTASRTGIAPPGVSPLGTSITSSRTRLHKSVQLAIETSHATFASISLADGSENFFAVAADAGSTVADGPGGFMRTVLATGSTLVIQDASADPRFSSLSIVVSDPAITSYVGAPIRAMNGAVIGVYGLYGSGSIALGPDLAPIVEGLATLAGDEFETAGEEDAALRVQEALLPYMRPRTPGYELAGTCTPTFAIGGDFFDWYPVAGGFAVTLGDVMGKGLGAGMLAAGIRAVLRASMDVVDPAEAVLNVDSVLAADFQSAESFSTLFHAHLRTEDGRLRFADAGHGLTIVVRRTGETMRLESLNLPIGVLSGQCWDWQSITLEPGDTLVTVSDGLLDLYDGTLASLTFVAEIAQRRASAHGIVEEIAGLARSGDALDDVTVVALRRLER